MLPPASGATTGSRRTFRSMSQLPVEEVLPALRAALRDRSSAVLQAPPASGKTTRVPLALLDEPWLGARRIALLEPRRLAARAAATYMARCLSEQVGGIVGYRIRHDTRVSERTRIEVVTEGILTRMIQADPSLEGIGLLVFDEFHERSLHADLGLALALHSQSLVRPDLRLLVMSATLDGGAVSQLLGGAPVVRAEGRSYPVVTRYRPPREGSRIEDSVAGAVRAALDEEAGDVLAFLPGAGEIRGVASRLARAELQEGIAVVPLYGDLAPEEQDRAILPSHGGQRKVVLATSIAQTSLTIEGIRVVIDAGLSRVSRFSPRTGMARLTTVRVSLASAEQRRGRAGRVASGVCYRLWAERLEPGFRAQDAPEILEADLAPLALELADAGISDPALLRWLDPPPSGALSQARELLAELGALEVSGGITPHGRRMVAAGVHPRLAHMLIRGAELGSGQLAAELAAILSDRDPLRRIPGAGADLRTRVDAMRRGDSRISTAVLQRLRRETARLRRLVGRRAGADPDGGDATGMLLALAYPDRIGQRRPGGGRRFLLRNGQGAVLGEPEAIGEVEYLVAAELDGDARESRIYLAAPVSLEEILMHYSGQLVRSDEIEWDEATQSVTARRRERLGAIVIRDAPLRDPPHEAVEAALLRWITRAGIGAVRWPEPAMRLRARLRFLRTLSDRWPDVSDEGLTAAAGKWLRPFLVGARRREDLERIDLAAALLAQLEWPQRRELDALAPSHVEVPSGSRIAVDYSDPAAPVLSVRLQEVFGWEEAPTVGGGRVPLTLHLLSPAGRPVQVTRDLAGFWRSTYFDVRKDLKGRYPKHAWPDDPLTARPTRRVRPRDGRG